MRLRTFSPELIIRENVKQITAEGAEFIDGTFESFTSIIFATG